MTGHRAQAGGARVGRAGRPEAAFQKALVQWLRLALPIGSVVHATNGEVGEGGRQGAIRQAIALGMGVHKGFADVIALADRRVAFFECKAPRKGPAPDQVEFARLMAAQGHVCAVVRRLEDAEDVLRTAGFPLRATLRATLRAGQAR